MVQDSLVDYISSQMKVGVTREAVKASLIGAGWQSADVEDTLKKVDGTKAALPTIVATSSKAASAFPATGLSSKPSDSQTIRVSDLISASGTGSSVKSSTATATSMPASMSSVAAAQKNSPKMSAPSSFSAMPETTKASGGGMIWKIATIAAVVVFGGLAGYFYMQNSSLAGKVSSLSAASAGVTANLASLNTQVAALNASNTALTASMASLSTQSAELSLELSFYAIPPGGATSAIGPVTLAGTLSGGAKVPYVITTSYGTKIYIQNSKDAKVIAALAPHAGASVEISGTYLEGSQNIAITAVNGTPI